MPSFQETETTPHTTSVIFSEFPEPLYPELLKSNDAPTPDQADGLRMLVNIAEVCLTRLSSAMHTFSLEASPRVIRNEQRRRVEFVRDYRKLVSSIPMRQVPNEIWGQIFLMYAKAAFDEEEKGKDEQGGRKRPKIPRAPVTLTEVCRRWRAIALSSPEIWSLIRVTLPTRPIQIRRWLALSKGRPLFARISMGEDFASHSHVPVCFGLVMNGKLFGADDENFLPPYAGDSGIYTLLSQSQRWAGLDIDVEGNWATKKVLRRIVFSATKLQSLRIRTIGTTRMILNRAPWVARNIKLPQLTDFTWRDQRISTLSTIPAYRNVTHLTAQFSNVESLTEVFDGIFKSMRRLSELDLTINCEDQLEPPDPQRHPVTRSVIHNQLLSFKLKWTAVDGRRELWPRIPVGEFLDCVDFPSLENFSLVTGAGIDSKPETISFFLSRHLKLSSLSLELPKCQLKLARLISKSRPWELVDSIDIQHILGDGRGETCVSTSIPLPAEDNWILL
ncbi:hypothetical protein VKT23_018352 [Stygiomarasmius scandens]|uniref:F-box domain-containing protein n=1 Tax=Marasmiellus scandens TaxID=2682957 RepID=A0ABR1IPH3_9AGAR